MTHRFNWVRLAIGVAAAVTIGAGVVLATIPDAAGVIHGCYSKSGSPIYVIDSAVSTCRNGDTALTWNVQGPPGPAGPMGAPGPTGATGPAGPMGPSDGFWKNDLRTFGTLFLDGNLSDLETLSQLPAGNYVLNATLAFVVDITTVSTVQCFLRTSDNPPVYLSSFVQSTVGGNASTFGSMTIGGAATLTAPTDVKASCISTGRMLSQPSSLTAIRVGTLTVQQ